MIPTHRMFEDTCPHCDGPLNAAMNANGTTGRPKEGDLTVCYHCGTLCVFQADHTLRLPTDEDLEDFTPDELRHLAAIQQHFRSRGAVH